jgi:uncharacterized protein (TIGR02145 family)
MNVQFKSSKRLFLVMIIILLLININAQQTGTFTDPRDGKAYKTVKIGHWIWMAENLNYVTKRSWCYNNDTCNCRQYGRLYTWKVAKKACPPGWHLPSIEEFETLLNNVGGKGIAAYNSLKQGGKSGFSPLFGGYRGPLGGYHYISKSAYFYSSSGDMINVWTMTIDSIHKIAGIGGNYPNFGHSVRCLKDKVHIDD